MAQPLTVTDLTKRYGRFVAVDGVSFAVAPGTITGLLGPNGSGKSSILHSLTGVVTPTSGSIEIAGNPHSSPAAKAALGFVPDDLALPLNVTGHRDPDRYAACSRGAISSFHTVSPTCLPSTPPWADSSPSTRTG